MSCFCTILSTMITDANRISNKKTLPMVTEPKSSIFQTFTQNCLIVCSISFMADSSWGESAPRLAAVLAQEVGGVVVQRANGPIQRRAPVTVQRVYLRTGL